MLRKLIPRPRELPTTGRVPGWIVTRPERATAIDVRGPGLRGPTAMADFALMRRRSVRGHRPAGDPTCSDQATGERRARGGERPAPAGLTSLRRSIAISMEEGPAHGAQPTPHGVATPSAGTLRPSKYSGTMANPGWLTAGLGGYAKGPRHHLWRQDPWPAVLLVAGEPRRPALVPLTLATPPRRKAPARASATRCS
jgi:hypothetical protein